MAPVHLVEIADEQRCLIPAGASTELHDTAATIGIAVVGTDVEELVPLLITPGPQFGKLSLGQPLELVVIPAAESIEVGDLPLEMDESPVAPRQPGERSVLTGDRGHPLRLGHDGRVDQLPLEFLESGELLFELVAHRPGSLDPSAERLGAGKPDPPGKVAPKGDAGGDPERAAVRTPARWWGRLRRASSPS